MSCQKGWLYNFFNNFRISYTIAKHMYLEIIFIIISGYFNSRYYFNSMLNFRNLLKMRYCIMISDCNRIKSLFLCKFYQLRNGKTSV